MTTMPNAREGEGSSWPRRNSDESSSLSEELSDGGILEYVWDVGLPMGAVFDNYEPSSGEEWSDDESRGSSDDDIGNLPPAVYASDSEEKEEKKNFARSEVPHVQSLQQFSDTIDS